MPSVGSTPTLTSPQQQQSSQQNIKLQLQHTLPMQLKLHLKQQYKQQQQHQQVTTTQPSPAGTVCLKSLTTLPPGDALEYDEVDEPSVISSTNSFSSVDTNQTLLNSIAAQSQKPQQIPLTAVGSNGSNGRKRASPNVTAGDEKNRRYRSKYGHFMIITPAVSIDRNFDSETGAPAADIITDNDESYFSNGNIFRMTLLQSSFDSGNSSDSSFCSNYNPNIYSSRYHLLPKATPPTFYTFQSWRWCSLICAAMRCFGSGAQHHRNSRGTTASTTYNTYLVRPSYQRSRSSGIPKTSLPMHRLRSSSTSTELFSSAYTPRKTRDGMNNITYEL